MTVSHAPFGVHNFRNRKNRFLCETNCFLWLFVKKTMTARISYPFTFCDWDNYSGGRKNKTWFLSLPLCRGRSLPLSLTLSLTIPNALLAT